MRLKWSYRKCATSMCTPICNYVCFSSCSTIWIVLSSLFHRWLFNVFNFFPPIISTFYTVTQILRVFLLYCLRTFYNPTIEYMTQTCVMRNVLYFTVNALGEISLLSSVKRYWYNVIVYIFRFMVINCYFRMYSNLWVLFLYGTSVKQKSD